MAYLTIILMLVGAVGGTLSYKANAALPGDLLYPYKTEVNERLEHALARTDTAGATWDISLLKERLDEAQILAQSGRLDARAQTQVTENVNEHVRNLTATVDKFQAEGHFQDAAHTMTELYNTLLLETQQVADQSLNASPTMQLSLAPILVKLRTTLNTVALISTKVQARAANLNSSPAQITAHITAAAEQSYFK